MRNVLNFKALLFTNKSFILCIVKIKTKLSRKFQIFINSSKRSNIFKILICLENNNII